jgi:hypothetical protein
MDKVKQLLQNHWLCISISFATGLIVGFLI